MDNTHILLLPLYLKIDSHIKANFNIFKACTYVILKFILLIYYLWMKEEYITTVDLWIVIEILQRETWHIGEDHSREFYHLREKFEI